MQKVSRLLALPTELRLRIFALALTSPKGLRYCKQDPSFLKHSYCDKDVEPETAIDHHFNQLKYVCRSLLTDTSDMELRVNDTLHFAIQRNTILSPAEHLITYIKSLSTRERGWLRTIIVEDESPRVEKDCPETVAELVRTCQQCPALILHYVFCNWSISSKPSVAETNFFLCIGIAYASAVRWHGYAELYQPGSSFDEMMRLTARFASENAVWRPDVVAEAVVAGKLRFMPRVCETMEEDKGFCSLFEGLNGVNEDEAAVQIEKWLEEGI